MSKNLQIAFISRAVRYDRHECASLLIQMGAEINSNNINNQTGLHIACLANNAKMAKMLIKQGASIHATTINGDQPIHLAVKGGSFSCLELFSSICSPSCYGALGNSLLHYAAESGQYEMMEHLIKQGFDANAKNELDETPLHLAAGAKFKGISPLFLRKLTEHPAKPQTLSKGHIMDFGETWLV